MYVFGESPSAFIVPQWASLHLPTVPGGFVSGTGTLMCTWHTPQNPGICTQNREMLARSSRNPSPTVAKTPRIQLQGPKLQKSAKFSAKEQLNAIPLLHSKPLLGRKYTILSVLTRQKFRSKLSQIGPRTYQTTAISQLANAVPPVKTLWSESYTYPQAIWLERW